MDTEIMQFLPYEARPEMHIAIKAAREGGSAVLKRYSGQYTTQIRENEPVTDADKESHNVITAILQETNIPILSEEGSQNLPDTEQFWLIDPLDGTNDFVNKTNEFTIIIALIEKSRPILSVIYWPTENIFYIAEKKKGAYLLKKEWQQMHVSSRKDIHYARALMSRHHLSPEEELIIKKLNIPWAAKGSALKTMEISAGNAELYFTFSNKISIWDTAAAYCIVKEAGGKMTDISGDKLLYTQIRHEHGVAVTNKHIHDELIHALRIKEDI